MMTALRKTHWSQVVFSLTLFLLLQSGCQSSVLKPTGSGMPPGDTDSLSLVVAQTRAQYPELSANTFQFVPHGKPQDSLPGKIVPVMQGEGTSVNPGFRKGKFETIEMILHLSKPDYDRGFAMISRSGGPMERFRIIAYEKRGEPQGAFEFTYALATPKGMLQYLVLLGGQFEDKGAKWMAFEGTLIEPSEDGNIRNWQGGFKINFGFRFPLRPNYQIMVDQADKLFQSLDHYRSRLSAMRENQEKEKRELATLKKLGPGKKGKTPGQGEIGEQEQKIRNIQQANHQAVKTMERDLMDYYKLRGEIAMAFSAFLRSNHFSWVPLSSQQDFFDYWKTVELHHPRIDKVTRELIRFLDRPTRITTLRKNMMAIVDREDNWSKNPGKKPGAKTR